MFNGSTSWPSGIKQLWKVAGTSSKLSCPGCVSLDGKVWDPLSELVKGWRLD